MISWSSDTARKRPRTARTVQTVSSAIRTSNNVAIDVSEADIQGSSY